jgi:hypothetical protein
MVFLRRALDGLPASTRLRENRATNGPHDQAGRGQQGLTEAAKTVAEQSITVG